MGEGGQKEITGEALEVLFDKNKLAKARKTRKSPGTLGFKKFGPGKLWVQQVWGQNIFINFLAELDNSKNFFFVFFSNLFF